MYVVGVAYQSICLRDISSYTITSRKTYLAIMSNILLGFILTFYYHIYIILIMISYIYTTSIS